MSAAMGFVLGTRERVGTDKLDSALFQIHVER